MTSQVYYRKWRPLSFQQLAGQEHVAATLLQSIKQGRVSHSYLFCGPRGSGKTTTARIMAKAVNCLDLQAGDPCNQCSICQSINDGRFMDIIELDAASNRGIDEIRDIREKVNFAPVQGKRKVYIIDEAHMLTDQASNAFLKTLEEPPAHVMFILCTTEAHKILPTIVSRCQRFDFRRIPADVIFQRLDEITRAEGATVDSDALRLVSRYAEGSLRDAENLLEQLVISYSDGVSVAQVEELLGLGNGERWLELAGYLLMGNTTAALGVVNQAAWDGTDLRQLHRQTQDLLRAAMLLQWGSAGLVDLPEHVISQLQDLLGQLPSWRIMKALKLWGGVNMRYDAPSTLPLELAVVEICDDQIAPQQAASQQSGQQQVAQERPQAQTAKPPAAKPPAARTAAAPRPQNMPQQETQGVANPTSAPTESPGSGNEPDPADSPRPPIDAPAPAATSQTANGSPSSVGARGQETGGPDPGGIQTLWLATVKELGRKKGKKYNLGALLRDCKSGDIYLEGDTLVLAFSNPSNLARMQEEMDDPVGRRTVTEVVTKHFGASYDFRLTLNGNGANGGDNLKPSQTSSLVRTIQGMGGRVIEETAE